MAYAIFTALHPGDGPVWTGFQDGTELLVAAIATAACTVRARRERVRIPSSPEVDTRAWAAWSLIAGGLGFWTAGQLGWTVVQVGFGQVPPQVSVLDGLFLLSPLLITVGLLAMVKTPAGYLSNTRAAVEGLFTAAGVLLLSWTLIVSPVSSHADNSTLVQAVHLAYPLLDVAALSAALFVAYWRRDDLPLGLGLLAVGIAFVAVSDSAFWYLGETEADFSGTTPLDSGWILGLLVIAASALWPSLKAPSRRHGVSARAFLTIPVLPAMAGVAVLVTRWYTGDGVGAAPGPVLAIVAGLVVLACGLMAVAGHESSALRRDLENRVEARTAELRSTERYYRALVQRASDVVMVLGPDLRILDVSDSVQGVFGFSPGRLRGEHLDFFGGDAAKKLTTALEHTTAPGQSTIIEWTLGDASGRSRHVESTATNLLTDPNIGGFVLNTRDATERTELEGQLRHQAFHDPLTGLANRALLADRTGQAFTRSLRTGAVMTVIVIELDGFKQFNDSLGHEAGDELLRSVAKRLDATARPYDTIARIGGDEFLVLAESADSRQTALAFGERLVEAIRQPFELGGIEYLVTASVGVAIGAASATDAEQLVNDAGAAMQAVRAAGRNGAQLFHPAMRCQAREHLRLQADLRMALEREQLSLLYQPQFSIEGRCLEGFEALIRWNHPTLGPVAPDRFIGLAEESGLIVPIGRWVLGEALRQAVAWGRAEGTAADVSVAVNVSAVQLAAPSLQDDVCRALRESGIEPSRVVLEITESLLVDDPHRIARVLGRLKKLGVRIAVDDFGTGYASLAVLQELPVDILKIDRAFVVAGGNRSRELLVAIAGLGRTLSLQTVAEGVERPDQLELVRDAGCDLVQGYLLGRPVPPEEAARLVDRAAFRGSSELPDLLTLNPRPVSRPPA